MTESRVPAGVPTGGQFAASARGESAASLAPVRLTVDQVAAMWDDDTAPTPDQQRVIDILTDPEIAEWCGEDTDPDVMAEELDGFGDDTGYYGAQQVAERLSAHYSRASSAEGDGAGEFSFSLDSTPDGEIGSYTVGVYLGHGHDAYLSKAQDSKYLNPERRVGPDATGFRKAVDLGVEIDADFHRMRAKALKAGLITLRDANAGTAAASRAAEA